MNYDIYTDGSCSGNPGPGGYAYIIIPENNMLLSSSKPFTNTTNNRMELMAIVQSINSILLEMSPNTKKVANIKIHTDSAYCFNPINQMWIKGWSLNRWKNSKGETIKNDDLWKELFQLMNNKHLNIEFHKIKGHSGNEYNEKVDKLAKLATLKAKERIDASKTNTK